MSTLRIRKTTLYLIGIVILVILGIYFVSSNSVSVIGNSNSGSGEVQKITLGFKNGNYYPNTINVEPNRPVRIYLDASVRGCYRSFTVKSFGVSKNLATPEDYVEFTPTKEGTYGFACSMGMGTGKMIVGNANANSATLIKDTNINTGSCGGAASGSGGCKMAAGGGCGCRG